MKEGSQQAVAKICEKPLDFEKNKDAAWSIRVYLQEGRPASLNSIYTINPFIGSPSSRPKAAKTR